MRSKKYVLISLVVLLGIYGFTTKNINGVKAANIVATQTIENENETTTDENTIAIATPNDELIEKFNNSKVQFNALTSLLKDEYENTILEANVNEYKDFVLSKKAAELLTQLDIIEVKVNINITAVKGKVVMFTLGKTWAANQNVMVVNTTAPIENALALTSNWYSIK